MPTRPNLLAQWPPHLVRKFPPEQRHLIGLSGGRDSVFLLRSLLSLGYRKLIVCHLDHRLRSASKTDARFVASLARRYDLQLEIGLADVPKLARAKKISLESAARHARYEFFARVARRRRCRTIFLGHHADDLVETFLFNLVRGAGPVGFGGIREVSVQRLGKTELTVVRPLLGIWREEIDNYLRQHQVQFREDKTNATLAPLRNRLRHRILPYIEKQLRRNVRMSLWRAATIAGEEDAWLAGFVDANFCEKQALPVPVMRAQPVALQRRTIRAWLRAHEIAEIDFESIERVRSLLDAETSVAKVNLPRDRHVRRRAKKIFIER